MPGSGPDEIAVLYVDGQSAGGTTGASIERADRRLSVECVDDAATAIETLEGVDVDCVVSEYALPGRTGIDLLERVRERYPDVPFILYTDVGSEAVASAAVTADATEYLRKEPDPAFSELAERIVAAVDEVRRQRLGKHPTAYLGAILEHASDYVVVIDDRDVIDYVSPAVERVLGYQPSELEGTNGLEYIFPSDRDHVVEAVSAVSSTPSESRTIEYRVRHADGTWRWLEVDVTNFVDESAVDGVLIVSRDVTERVESRHQRETILENLPGYIYRSRTEGTWPLEFVEGAAEEITGYTARELVEDIEIAEEVIHPDDRAAVRAGVEAGLADAGRYDLTYRFVSRSGETGWLWDRGILAEDPVSGEAFLDGFVTDVTERKEQEHALERQNERLAEFSSIVSHDLRNPLNLADGYLELVREDCDSAHVDEVSAAHERMNELIDDLLRLAQVGAETGSRERLELEAEFERSWQTVATADATIRIDVDRAIQANASQFQQLVANLFQNAIGHGGPDVTVSVGPLEDGIYVEDDGPGIPEPDRPNVFDASYSEAQDGVGYGLRIVERVAEDHDWTVTVTDGADGGARFEISGIEFLE